MTYVRGETTPIRPDAARTAFVALLLLAPLGLLACGPAGEGAGAEGEAPEEAASADDGSAGGGDPGGLEAGTWLDGVSTGHAVDPQGAVPADSAGSDFAPGDVIYVSMSVGDAPADAAVHVAFYGPAGEMAAEDEKKVPAEARYLYFDSGDTRNWEPGTYRVEIAVDGEVVDEKALSLAAPLAQ